MAQQLQAEIAALELHRTALIASLQSHRTAIGRFLTLIDQTLRMKILLLELAPEQADGHLLAIRRQLYGQSFSQEQWYQYTQQLGAEHYNTAMRFLRASRRRFTQPHNGHPAAARISGARRHSVACNPFGSNLLRRLQP